MEAGRWKMGDGRWKMEDGRWVTEDGRWKLKDYETPRCLGVTTVWHSFVTFVVN